MPAEPPRHPAATADLLRRAETEPINCDISDYSDEWCDGFLAGQRNVLEEIAARRLDLPFRVSHSQEGSEGSP